MNEFTNFHMEYFVIRTCLEDWVLVDTHTTDIIPYNGFLLILEGELTYYLDDVTYQLKPGDLLFFKPGSKRQARANCASKIVAIDFTSENFSVDFPVKSKIPLNGELLDLIRQYQYKWLTKGEGWELETRGLFLMIFNHLQNPTITEQNIYVEKIKHYIIDNYYEHLSVEILANYVGLNPIYCGSLFKENQGITILEFIRDCRIRQASAMLQNTGQNITDIALSCGFGDIYIFSKVFKSYFGVNPSKYRKNFGITPYNHLPAEKK